MKIGILVCGESSDKIKEKYKMPYEDFFTEPLGLADASLEFEAFDIFDNKFPKSVHDCDGWLVTGSKNGVYEQLDWMGPLEIFIKKAYDFYIPIVGVCFGHQMIAHALGGLVEKSEKGWGLGYQEYEQTNDLAFDLPKPLQLFAIHQDQVIECPPDAHISLRNDHCEIAGLIYKGPAMSFQAHPEFSEQFERDLIESIRGDSIPEAFADPALANLHNKKVHNDQIMQLIAHFFLNPPQP